ncbi:protein DETOXIFICATION 7-like isoform X2 [Euphorbia lathyris]|uniref:protein DETOXIFICATION 7-like isoform X2 n=1 Tax=Euphorbia lathyris TaxID=212925 RepID=UPI0033132276
MEEVKRVSLIAAPMVIVSVSQYLLTAVSLMMAGHLGQLHLSAVSVAASFTNATRFPVLFGLSGALETLCGQVYGARQYKKIGSYTYTAISSLVSICVLISILWIFMDKLLISIGFDPQISRVASRYSIALIPALFGYAILQSLIRYFQSQGFTLPILVTSSVTFCFHLPLCWALIYKCHFGEIGGSISIGLAYWLNVFLLGLYMRYSPSCQQTRCFCFKEVCSSLHQFWHFAFPSAVMVCTRVSNELGAGNPKAARSVVWVVLGISLTEAAIVSTSLFCARNVFGYAYSNDKQVIKYVSQIAPLLSLSIISDTMQAILSGVTRGCGLQRTGAFINLGAYYFVGMPISIVLCFLMHFRAKGLWMGALIGSLLQAAFLALVTLFINWNNQATMAKDRILKHQLQSTVEGIEL